MEEKILNEVLTSTPFELGKLEELLKKNNVGSTWGALAFLKYPNDEKLVELAIKALSEVNQEMQKILETRIVTVQRMAKNVHLDKYNSLQIVAILLTAATKATPRVSELVALFKNIGDSARDIVSAIKSSDQNGTWKIEEFLEDMRHRRSISDEKLYDKSLKFSDRPCVARSAVLNHALLCGLGRGEATFVVNPEMSTSDIISEINYSKMLNQFVENTKENTIYIHLKGSDFGYPKIFEVANEIAKGTKQKSQLKFELELDLYDAWDKDTIKVNKMIKRLTESFGGLSLNNGDNKPILPDEAELNLTNYTFISRLLVTLPSRALKVLLPRTLTRIEASKAPRTAYTLTVESDFVELQEVKGAVFKHARLLIADGKGAPFQNLKTVDDLAFAGSICDKTFDDERSFKKLNDVGNYAFESCLWFQFTEAEEESSYIPFDASNPVDKARKRLNQFTELLERVIQTAYPSTHNPT